MIENLKQLRKDPLKAWTLFTTLFFAVTFTTQVVTGVLNGDDPQTFIVASAALVSLGVLAGISFTYAALIEQDQTTKRAIEHAGLRLFYAVVLVVIAAGAEWFLRLYLTPWFAQFKWLYVSVISILAVSNTLIFWRAITYGYRGVMELKDTLWALMKNSGIDRL